MKKFEQNLWQKGSLMVEAIAMLGLITMVTPVLYKKAAERTSELQDINTANQMRTISKALDDYIQDNYVNFTTNTASDMYFGATTDSKTITADKIAPYLPYGFDMDNSRFLKDYQIGIRKSSTTEGRSVYTGMVTAAPRGDLNRMRAAKVASMIGANGGMVQNELNPDGSVASSQIMGVGGGWGAAPSDYFPGSGGSSVSLSEGTIAVTSAHAVMSEGGVSEEDVLFRKKHASGDERFNTMSVDLSMGKNDIKEIDTLIGISENSKNRIKVNSDLTVANGVSITGSHLEGKGLHVAQGAKIASGLTVTSGGAGITGGLTSVNETKLKGWTAIGRDSQEGSYMLSLQGSQHTSGNQHVAGHAVIGGVAQQGSNKLTVLGDQYGSGNLVIAQKTTTGDGTDAIMLQVQGQADIDKDLTVNETLTVDQTSALKGAVTIGTNEADTATMLTVNGSEVVKGNLTVGTSTAVRKATIYGDADVTNTLRAGEVSGSYNFVAGDSSVTIDKPNFLVDTDRLVVDATKTEMHGSGNTFVTADANTVSVAGTYFKVKTDRIYADDTKSELKGSGDSYVTATGNDVNVTAANAVTIKGDSDGNISEFVADSTGARLKSKNGTYAIDLLTTGSTTITSPKVVVADATNMTNVNASGKGELAEKGYKAVVIHRDGVIELPMATGTNKTLAAATAGKVDKVGYIKADRLLSNVAHPGKMHTETSGGSNYYDAYQVNPAYTSVMHDIKLTTRGGARLSDILPEFINRGIYVLDNTYAEDGSNWTESSYKPAAGTATVTKTECGTNANCIATPWLGFVPAPQCPPGYAKVITVNPVRWKMAEAYFVMDDGTNLTQGNYSSWFTSNVLPRTSPVNANFVLGANTNKENHSHGAIKGLPLTFQTNTWLNTTVSAGNDTSGAFQGWHAIMGFLYYGNQYAEYLAKVGQSSVSGRVYWNLFPVFNQEMSAIANVYCYFDRTSNYFETDVKGNYIAPYEQIANYRSGYDKKATNYTNRLNDPALGYNEVW